MYFNNKNIKILIFVRSTTNFLNASRSNSSYECNKITHKDSSRFTAEMSDLKINHSLQADFQFVVLAYFYKWIRYFLAHVLEQGTSSSIFLFVAQCRSLHRTKNIKGKINKLLKFNQIISNQTPRLFFCVMVVKLFNIYILRETNCTEF